MVDILQQATNVIAYLMNELGKKEIEIPADAFFKRGADIIAQTNLNDPLSQNVIIKVSSRPAPPSVNIKGWTDK